MITVFYFLALPHLSSWERNLLSGYFKAVTPPRHLAFRQLWGSPLHLPSAAVPPQHHRRLRALPPLLGSAVAKLNFWTIGWKPRSRTVNFISSQKDVWSLLTIPTWFRFHVNSTERVPLNFQWMVGSKDQLMWRQLQWLRPYMPCWWMEWGFHRNLLAAWVGGQIMQVPKNIPFLLQ